MVKIFKCKVILKNHIVRLSLLLTHVSLMCVRAVNLVTAGETKCLAAVFLVVSTF